MKLHQKMDSHHKKEKKGLTRGWRQASDVRSTPPDDLTSDATTKPVVFGYTDVFLLPIKKISEQPCSNGDPFIHRFGVTMLTENEKLFGRYWRQVFGPPSTLIHLLGKVISVYFLLPRLGMGSTITTNSFTVGTCVSWFTQRLWVTHWLHTGSTWWSTQSYCSTCYISLFCRPKCR